MAIIIFLNDAMYYAKIAMILTQTMIKPPFLQHILAGNLQIYLFTHF